MHDKNMGILVALLLFLCADQPLMCGQVNARDPNSSSTRAPAGNPSVPSERIFTATLLKTMDVTKMRAGDVFFARGNDTDTISLPITFAGRVVEVHKLGDGSKDSLLVIHFEKAVLENKQEIPVRLRLQAVAARANVGSPFSTVIVDRFPCDYGANPEQCHKQEGKQQDPPPGLNPSMKSVCEKNPIEQKGQLADRCVSLSEANGIYGFPDFSLASYLGEADLNFAIASSKKNVRIEQGTYFVLSGPDLDTGQKTQP